MTAVAVAAIAAGAVVLLPVIAIAGWLSWEAIGQSRRTKTRLDGLDQRIGQLDRATSTFAVTDAHPQIHEPNVSPLVSAILTTRDRPALLALAVACYQQQTYANKELIIVDDGERQPLTSELAAAANARLLRLAPGATLGAKLNAGAGAARGTLCQYLDIGAWYGPRFLETMVAAWQEQRRPASAPAAVVLMPFLFFDLGSAQIQQPAEHEAPSATLLFERDAWAAHPFSSDSAAGDLQFLADQATSGREVIAARAIESHVAIREETEIRTRNGLWQQLAGAGRPTFSRDQPLWERSPEQILSEWARQILEVHRPPRVLILTPVKDAADCLDRYCELVIRLNHPHDRLSLGFLESDSVDGTYEAIEQRLPLLRAELHRVELWKHDFGYRLPPNVPRWEPSIQKARRTVLAKSRNELLFRALQDEEWVLWIDVDVIDYPADLIERLLETGKDIVQPHCVYEPGGRTFDLNGWRDHGLLHLDDLRREADLVRLDAVGGTVLLVRAAAHREGLIFPAFSYGINNPLVRGPAGEVETEGLGMMAHDLGYECWGMPNFEVIHRRA